MKKRTLLSALLLFPFVLLAQTNNEPNPGFGTHIVTVVPIQFLSNNQDDYSGGDVALGVAYEKILKNEYVGIKLPFSFSLKSPGFFYFMPGVKLYPKKQGVVKYAVGPQFSLGIGTVKRKVYDYNSPYGTYIIYKENSTQLGFMINNSLNVTVAKEFYLGIELGIGVQYFDSRDNNDQYFNDDYNSTLNATAQFNFSMGYRF